MGMRTTSLDLRERILAAYDNQEGTRAEMADRFRVSLGLVKKLLQQRRRTDDIAPRHRFSGRKPMIVATHRNQLRVLLAKKNDLTLKELRGAAGLKCSLQAINVVLGKMALTYKKRHSAPASKTAPTSPGRGGSGGSGRRAGIRPS
jgi:transposase